MADVILETTSRLVAWRINSLNELPRGTFTSREFFIGKWYWVLECYKFSDGRMQLILTSLIDKRHLSYPTASFVLRVFCSKGSPIITTAEWTDHKIPYRESFVCLERDMSTLHATPVTFSVEFMDLKMEVGNDKKICSIWKEESYSEQNAAVEPISRMLSESIYTDIVINAMEGSIKAHRAILAANSPVFRSMFSENYIEKETSTVNINDISTEACRAMLNFLYGKRDRNELQAHRMELILAADIYDIVNLKRACETSLCEDVGVKNVFEFLMCAHRFNLIDLKRICLFYLLKMGMIFELQEGYNSFLREADRELIVEVSSACLKAWEIN